MTTHTRNGSGVKRKNGMAKPIIEHNSHDPKDQIQQVSKLPDDHATSVGAPSEDSSNHISTRNADGIKPVAAAVPIVDDDAPISKTATVSVRIPVIALLRFLLLDSPLLMFCGLYLLTAVLSHIHDEYLSPQMDLMYYDYDRKESEATYYSRVCDADDITTHDVDDLVLHRNVTALDAMEHMLTHGVSLYPDVLSGKTADSLRSFIVEANKKEANYYVIAGEHRFTFGLRVDHHPSVVQAMHEIATHPTLVPALEMIAGPNPAIIELSPITSEFGAEEQWWHQDTLPQGSSFKHARSFFPSYSIFIPLQDTSAALGSTQICPGSHICDGNDEMCVEEGMFVSGDQDNWPRGTAAVMNQHSHHRGTAHRLRRGPDRVLFVMTVAPRPLAGALDVETRLLSQGGSYSMHYAQWGHTLDDFRDAKKFMRQPWRILRSLGIYKPRRAHWGWDWITTSSMRIANDDNGYHQDQLDEFMTTGGFWFLPGFLHGHADDGWRFFLRETLANCKEFLFKVVCCGLVVHCGIALLWYAVVRRQGIATTMGRWVLRLAFLCGPLLIIAGAFVYRVSKTTWALHIRQGKSFNPGIGSIEPPMTSPATLPNRRDILVDTRYNSRHLWSYNHILDYAHPGNKRFRSIVIESAARYDEFPVDLKKRLIDEIVDQALQTQGRFLSPNEVGKWTNTPLNRVRVVCHEELMKKANAFVQVVMTETSYLLSDLKFGHWRTAGLSRHLAEHLKQLQDKLVDPPTWKPAGHLWAMRSGVSHSLMSKPPFTMSSSTTNLQRHHMPHLEPLDVRRDPAPPRPAIVEPFVGAWFKEGDTVEGRYECNFNEWYKGTIHSISMDEATYSIRHEDGYIDEDLPRSCVRPFEPYMVGELIAFRINEEYIDGQIVKVHPDGLCDVQSHEHGFHFGVAAADLQRFDHSR